MNALISGNITMVFWSGFLWKGVGRAAGLNDSPTSCKPYIQTQFICNYRGNIPSEDLSYIYVSVV